MIEPQREALAALRFNWAETPDHVWTPSPYHVDGLHGEVEREIVADIAKAAASDGPSPIGLVVQGQKGVGKTHLLGWVRQQVQRAGGYFVLFELKTGNSFWKEAAASVRDGLLRTGESDATQLTRFLTSLCELAGVPETAASAITGSGTVSPSDIDVFIDALQLVDRRIGTECADTATALALYASRDRRKNGVGRDYLSGEAITADERQTWGIRTDQPTAMAVVRDVFRLLALVGPSVVAVDQLDTLVAKSTTRITDTRQDPELAKELALIADGLMQLREVTRRTLSIVACLPNSWALLQATAVDTVMDRFTEAFFLGRITDAALGRALVEKWLGVPYQRIGFVPPHPTWPVAPAAFEGGWDEYTPRELQKIIDKHVETCLRGEIRELTSFDTSISYVPAPLHRDSEPEHFAALDGWFAELRDTVDVAQPLDPKSEDKVMPALLSAALRSWITEVGNDDMVWEIDPPAGVAGLHARIRRALDEELDTTEQWAFRAIAAPHHRAVQKRMSDACDAAGLGTPDRHLVVIRNEEWSKGPKTRADLADLYRSGGQAIGISEEDVRTFGALREMLTKPSLELREWLVARRPASTSALLSATMPSQESRPPPPVDGIVVGTAGEESVSLELESLRKHAVIFAGSGSGKTVLIRRLIEECALRGVSAIVLDPNNDLARLGDGWPEPPDSWLAGDEHRAQDYLANTDVVVWTPGRSAGRPLSFHPLPDFASVLDDHDEFTASVEAAVATLAPHAMVTGNTAKANRGRAVLREALTEHARTGSRSLRGFIEFLADLPEGVSRLGNGTAIAADLAESLKAATVNDPLFAGAGEPADPALLFTPAQGKRARISVISFVGLPSDEQRQGFVSQLQMEVFAWIKRNPAGDRPLGGLFVMDEAQTLAPSGGWTASTQSTIILASQARKYGLGLIFATQAPKGLHNQIPGNATTQFFGRLQSPAQLAAANEMARAKGSTVEDIALLERGQFYVTGEAFGFRRIQTAMCLSHHPPSPLRLEEVIERSRA